MDKTIRVGVGLYIINNQHQLLLGLRKSPHGQGTWCPPGGHMEFGESNEQAAIREAKEETGLDIDSASIKLGGITNDYFQESDKHYITLHLITHKYNGTPQIMEPDKCAQWRWFDVDGLPTNLFLSAAHFLATHNLRKL